MSRGTARDIAIVGLGCRFPGADDLYAFWANILANRDMTREVPADRWPLGIFHDPDSDSNDRVSCRRSSSWYSTRPRQLWPTRPSTLMILAASASTSSSDGAIISTAGI